MIFKINVNRQVYHFFRLLIIDGRTAEPERSIHSVSDACQGSNYYDSNAYEDETFEEMADVLDVVEYDQSDAIKIEWEYNAAYFGEYDGAPILRTSNGDSNDYHFTESSNNGM